MTDAAEIGLELALPDGLDAGLEALVAEFAALDAAAAAGGVPMDALPGMETASAGGAADGAVAGTAPVMTGEDPRGAPMAEGGPASVTVVEAAAVLPAAPGGTKPPDPGQATAKPWPLGRVPPISRGAGSLAGAPEKTAAPVVGGEVVAVAPVAGVPATPAEALQAETPRDDAVAQAAPPGSGRRRLGAVLLAASPPRVVGEDGDHQPAARFGAGEAMDAGVAPVPRDASMQADVAAVEQQGPAWREAAAGRHAVRMFGHAGRVADGAAPAHGSRRTSAPTGGSFAERGAAPRPESEGRGEGGAGGGTVVLDGRLVGQWLSERMARDAARPGAGTTFFDPRQAPAWTPSGVL